MTLSQTREGFKWIKIKLRIQLSHLTTSQLVFWDMHLLQSYVVFSCFLLVRNIVEAVDVKSCSSLSPYIDPETADVPLTVDVYDCSNTLIPPKETCSQLKKDWIGGHRSRPNSGKINTITSIEEFEPQRHIYV